MPRMTTNNPSNPTNDAAPKQMFITMVPAAPTSIARLPPILSVIRPLMIWPNA